MTDSHVAAQGRSSKRYRILSFLSGLAVRKPGIVLALAGVVSVVAAVFIPQIEVVTDRGSLVDSDEPSQQRYRHVTEMFGNLSVAVVVLQGDQREALRRTADEIADLFEGEPRIRSVFYRLDMDFFLERALLYLPEEQLDCVGLLLDPSSISSSAPDQQASLLGLTQALASQFESASADQAVPEHCQTINPLRLLTRLFGEIEAWTTSPDRAVVELLRREDLPQGGLSPDQYGVDEEGYLVERAAAEGEESQQGHLLFMLVQPESTSTAEAEARQTTMFIREQAGAIAETHGVTLGVTGMPAIITDELGTVRRDVKQTIIGSIICVVLLFFLTFRSFRATLLVTVPLVLGLIWTAGFAALVYQKLTMVSVYFAAVLFGLGIAFGIHLLSRFDEARRLGKAPAEAVDVAMVGAGPGVVTGGVTTAAAFLAVGFCDFKGFAQLGVVAGVGVLLMLGGALTVMPACLYLWRGEPSAASGRAGWLGSVGHWLERHPNPVLGATALAVAAGVYGASSIPFDYDFTKLLPARVEALTYYRLMEERSVLAPDVAISVATSLDEAEELRTKLEALDTVARAEGISKYLPGTAADQGKRLTKIREIAAKVEEPARILQQQAKQAVAAPRRPEPETLAGALDQLGDAAEDAWFAAQQTGRSEAADLARLSKKVRAAAGAVREAPRGATAERLAALEAMLFRQLARGMEVLLANLDQTQVLTAGDLPDNIRQRFVATNGDGNRYAVYAYPTGRVGERDFLDQFYRHLVSVDPEVTGFPVTHYFHGELARRAFFQAALYAALATLLLLAVDFRRLRDVILAALPLAVGATLMLGTMSLLGWSYNFVNVVALPLVFGAGVDFGVHLVHRFRQEGSPAVALATTGRPVVLSAAITLVGIGGLALAEHRGAASLGWLMVVGIAQCLVAAAIVLPAAMAFWTRRHRPTGGPAA